MTTGGTVDVASLTFRSDKPVVDDVASARRRLLDCSRQENVPPDIAEFVVLAASELVTNAIRHARTSFELTVEVDDDIIDLRVFDADSRLPLLAGTDEDAVSGRGIQIVAAVADEWGAGTEERDGLTGKTVWARFGLRNPASDR